MTTNQPNRKTA